MSETSKLSGTFYELNYLIDEETALQVREHVREYLELDENCVGRPNFQFRIHTLYLDSQDLLLYRRAVNDIEHRRQLRVRSFSRDPETPVHLEIKRRMADVVIRESAEVRRKDFRQILSGQPPGMGNFLGRNPREFQTMQQFVELAQAIQARPRLHITFLREAYVDDTERFRVTMDRQIRCQSTCSEDLECDFEEARSLFNPGVLLELSFLKRYPEWFSEMVQHFDLVEREADKYVDGITMLGCGIGGRPG